MGRREMSAPRRNWLSSLQRQRPREVGGKMDLEAGPRRQSVGRSDGPHADRHLRDHAREEEAALVRSFVDPSAVAAMHYSRRKEGRRIGVKVGQIATAGRRVAIKSGGGVVACL